MTITEFIDENRGTIIAGIGRVLDRPDWAEGADPEWLQGELRLWCFNDEGLYTWAKEEGVDMDGDCDEEPFTAEAPEEKAILHETSGGSHWVRRAARGYYEVFKTGVTHSVRVAVIGEGPAPSLGLTRAIAEAERREAALA